MHSASVYSAAEYGISTVEYSTAVHRVATAAAAIGTTATVREASSRTAAV